MKADQIHGRAYCSKGHLRCNALPSLSDSKIIDIRSLLYLAKIAQDQEGAGFALRPLYPGSLAGAVYYLGRKNGFFAHSKNKANKTRNGSTYIIDKATLQLLSDRPDILATITENPETTRLLLAGRESRSLLKIGMIPSTLLPVRAGKELDCFIRTYPDSLIRADSIFVETKNSIQLNHPEGSNSQFLNALLNQATVVSEVQLINALSDHVFSLLSSELLIGKSIAFLVLDQGKSNSYITYLAMQLGKILPEQVFDNPDRLRTGDVVVILDDLACSGCQALESYYSLSEKLKRQGQQVIFAPLFATQVAVEQMRNSSFQVFTCNVLAAIDLNRLADESGIDRVLFSSLGQERTLILLPHMCPDNNVPIFSQAFGSQICLTLGIKQPAELIG